MLKIKNYKKIQGRPFIVSDGGSYVVLSAVEGEKDYGFYIQYHDGTEIWIKIERNSSYGLVNGLGNNHHNHLHRVYLNDVFDCIVNRSELMDIRSTLRLFIKILEG